ncbi:small acid-soluble spore protein P [Paenibacillus chartarius]|uniref:Small acid-soluble spore protein P n=1 Tax=Paenibacillus chartarius TaxID=747481 RepID=A0ABV6DUN5_9BACL
MSKKDKSYSVGLSYAGPKPDHDNEHHGPTAPLSGSKKVKNRQHSRNNHGEGH